MYIENCSNLFFQDVQQQKYFGKGEITFCLICIMSPFLVVYELVVLRLLVITKCSMCAWQNKNRIILYRGIPWIGKTVKNENQELVTMWLIILLMILLYYRYYQFDVDSMLCMSVNDFSSCGVKGILEII